MTHTSADALQPSYDVIVIGGGLAGLATAAYVSRAGRRALVLEQRATLGGRARTTVVNGWHLNLGPHALYRSGAAMSVLAELGVQCPGAEPGASGAYAVRSGLLHTLPAGFVSLLATDLLGPLEKLEAGRLLKGLKARDTTSLQSTSLAQWLNEEISQPAVRDLLRALVRLSTYCDDETHLSAGAALDQLRLALDGVLYLDGGWQPLVDQLQRLCDRTGVDVLVTHGARSVDCDTRVRGVALEDGRRITAASVVIAGGPETARAVTHGARCASTLARWTGSIMPVRLDCLDVALRALPRPRARFALGIDEPLYVSVHSNAAKLAPDGGAVVHAALYRRSTRDGSGREARADTERRLTHALDLLQPDWNAVATHRRFLHDMIVSHAIVTAAQGGAAGRPGPEVPEAPGLYVVGDWIGREGMLADAALASARHAARAIVATQPRVEHAAAGCLTP